MSRELSRAEVAALAEAILARGLDVERLATATGLGIGTVQMIMRGELRPEAHIRRKLAQALGLDPGRLGL